MTNITLQTSKISANARDQSVVQPAVSPSGHGPGVWPEIPFVYAPNSASIAAAPAVESARSLSNIASDIVNHAAPSAAASDFMSNAYFDSWINTLASWIQPTGGIDQLQGAYGFATGNPGIAVADPLGFGHGTSHGSA